MVMHVVVESISVPPSTPPYLYCPSYRPPSPTPTTALNSSTSTSSIHLPDYQRLLLLLLLLPYTQSTTTMSAFDTAVEDSRKLKAKPTDDELLQVRSLTLFIPHSEFRISIHSRKLIIPLQQLYALFKVATDSDFASAPQPGTFDFKVCMPSFSTFLFWLWHGRKCKRGTSLIHLL